MDAATTLSDHDQLHDQSDAISTHRRRRRRVFVVLALVAAALGLWAVLHKKAKPAPPPPPIPVEAVRAERRDLQLTLGALGAAQAWTSDTILAQVSGKLIRVNFREGGDVRAGQVLAEVDPAPYRAALDSALGTLHRDEATLAGAERDLLRYQRLVQENSIARQTAEDESATVAQDRGTVELDRANVEAARINLRWTRIVSPVSGRVGVRLVDPGNLVSASGSAGSAPTTAAATNATSAGTSTSSGGGIVVVNEIEPIAVTFTVPEDEFDELSRLSNGFRRPLAVQAYGQESGALISTGELRIADNKVDSATGTVELKARFANGDRRLWPGQFVDVKLGAETLPGAVVIPTTAVNRGPNGSYAFVIGPNGRATMRRIVTEGTEGSVTAVKSGLNAGDLVVTDGQMTLKQGSAVRLARPASAPASTPAGGAGA